MKNINIKNPEWLKHSTPGKTIALFNNKGMPPSIAGWMIVVSLRHPLRAVYGSDLRAALALLWWAVSDKTIGRFRLWIWGLKDKHIEE